jgi:hypothetical protein
VISEDALAVIISTGSAIDFCFLSNPMKTLPQLSWLRKGTPVPAGTLTARFNADRDRVLRAERVADEIKRYGLARGHEVGRCDRGYF